MFKTEQDLLTDVNFAFASINEELVGKKIVGIIKIDNFIVSIKKSEMKKQNIVALFCDEKIVFHPLDVTFEPIKLTKARYSGMYVMLHVEWDCVFRNLGVMIDKEDKVEVQVIEVATFSLNSTDPDKEAYCVCLYINKLGFLLVLFDDVENYFEDCTVSLKQKDGIIENFVPASIMLEALNALSETTLNHKSIDVDYAENSEVYSIPYKVNIPSIREDIIYSIVQNKYKTNQIFDIIMFIAKKR